MTTVRARRFSTFLRAFAIFCCLCAGLLASPAVADKRVALVIGASEYRNTQKLANAVSDARDIGATLRSLGFEVIARDDPDKGSFTRALAEFARAATGADIALFFYAGHGMQYQGQNYLFPVDAELRDEISVQYELVAVDEVRRALERSAGVRILILDACRDNPLAAQYTRALATANRNVVVTRGLARVEQAHGSVVVFSTQANEVATDGAARNSPFTRALLDGLREPGMEIGAMLRKVSARVYTETAGKQIPEISMSLLTDVYLNREPSDTQVWSQLRGGADLPRLRDFIEKFPASVHAADARLRIEALDREEQARQLEIVRAGREALLREQMAALETERARAAGEVRAREQAARDIAESLRKERAEKERIQTEAAERDQAAREANERLRLDQARAERAAVEAMDRLRREQQEKERLSAEALSREKAAREAMERSRLEQVEKEKLAAAALARERAALALAEDARRKQAESEQRARAAERDRSQAADADRARRDQVESARLAVEIQAREKAVAEAGERVRAGQVERERLATEVAAREKAVAEAAERLRLETVEKERIAGEAARREAALQAKLTELENAGRALAESAKPPPEGAGDERIAGLVRAREAAEARLAMLEAEKRQLAARIAEAAPAPVRVAALPPSAGRGQEALTRSIKTELRRIGCYSGAIDANWRSPDLRKAIAKFAIQAKLSALPDDPGQGFLDDLAKRQGRVCPLVCGARSLERNGRCVAKSCPAGEILDAAGDCAPRPRRVVAVAPEPRRASPRRPLDARPSRAGCFIFNGQRFCE